MINLRGGRMWSLRCYANPKVTTGNFNPKVTTGNFNPKVTTGNFNPKVTTGNFNPKVIAISHLDLPAHYI